MPDMRPQGEIRPGNPPAHEADVVSLRGIFGFALGLIVLTVAVMLVVRLFMSRYAADESRAQATIPPLLAAPVDFQGPHIQGNPYAERVEVQREQLQRLNGYGWVDRKAGIARIPISRAIDLLLERGLPEIKDAAPTGEPPGPPAREKTP